MAGNDTKMTTKIFNSKNGAIFESDDILLMERLVIVVDELHYITGKSRPLFSSRHEYIGRIDCDGKFRENGD